MVSYSGLCVSSNCAYFRFSDDYKIVEKQN